MRDGSRQHLSAIVRGIGLDHRNSVLAGQQHRSTSCDAPRRQTGSQKTDRVKAPILAPGSPREPCDYNTLRETRLLVSTPKTAFS